MKVALLALAAIPVQAQFGNIFENIFRQHAQKQKAKTEIPADSNWVEHQFYEASCDKYLCTDTLACVNGPMDCPCPFGPSQLKCVLPNKKSYVCISQPAEGDEDPRDCSFVNEAWYGKV